MRIPPLSRSNTENFTNEKLQYQGDMHLFSIWLFISICLGALSDISVYHINDDTSIKLKISINPSVNEALAYFSDRFNLNAFKLGDYNKQEIIQFIEAQNEMNPTNDKPKLIITLNGVKFNQEPSFKVIDTDDSFVSQFNQLISNESTQELTNEINVINIKNLEELKSHFKYFSVKLTQIWDNFRQNVFSKDINHINDQFYINEMSQLIHLNDFEFTANDVIVINLNSLNSLSSKIGDNSQTYKSSEKLLSDLLKLSQFDILVIDKLPVNKSKVNKRNQELKVFFRDEKKQASNGCFDTEEACQVNTSNCNSHGICTKVSKGCWSCACSATVDKKSSKTTNWSGFDCSKQDISSTANLLLWSSITLLVMFAGGVKLLVAVGSEKLPAILDSTSQ